LKPKYLTVATVKETPSLVD